MAEIDPQAVFVSDDGEVIVAPQHARQSRVVQARFPQRPSDDPKLHFETVAYWPLSMQPEATHRAICRLLEERDAEAVLVDRCWAALDEALRHGVGFIPSEPDKEIFSLMGELHERWRRRQQR